MKRSIFILLVTVLVLYSRIGLAEESRLGLGFGPDYAGFGFKLDSNYASNSHLLFGVNPFLYLLSYKHPQLPLSVGLATDVRALGGLDQVALTYGAYYFGDLNKNDNAVGDVSYGVGLMYLHNFGPASQPHFQGGLGLVHYTNRIVRGEDTGGPNNKTMTRFSVGFIW